MTGAPTSVLVSRSELITVHSSAHLQHCNQIEFLDQKLIPSFEAPERMELILRVLQDRGLLSAPVSGTAEVDLSVAHDPVYVEGLALICRDLDGSKRVLLPATWPSAAGRSRDGHPAQVRLGRWSHDTFTSVGSGTFAAAAANVGCVVAAFRELHARGSGTAFALGRPPHHHAGPDYMNGYCYLNGTALAAVTSRRMGLRVAVVDVDYHHGNGTQHILYDKDILFCSIHGDPSFAFPFFTGFADEIGVETGEGFNLNVPLAAGTGWPEYEQALRYVMGRISAYSPDLMIVSLGVDTFEGDPVGRFSLRSDDFKRMGQALAGLSVPALFVMEGGYAVREIGENVSNVLCEFLA